MNSPLWMTSEGTLISDPAAQGFKQTDCGPDMLCREDSEFCERVGAFRAHVAAVDGDWKRTLATAAKVKAFLAEYDFNGDGGVCSDGIARFDGLCYRTVGSKLWFPISAAAVLKFA